MKNAVPLAALLGLCVAVGCSSASSSSGSGGGSSADGGLDGPPGSKLQKVHFHMEETIPAGQEVFKCQVVALPNVTGWMVAGDHSYTAGSHHLLLFNTDLTSIPPGADQVGDCYEGAQSGLMGHVRGMFYGAQAPTGSMQFPAGIGLPTTPGQLLIFQMHYLNATASSLDAKVDVDITLDTGTDITTNAGNLFFYDPFIDVPAGAKAKASMRCLIPKDITLLSAQSHYHARGVGYSAFLDDSAAALASSPFYTSASWSSPALQTMSTSIKGGSHLRFECDYDNSAGTQEYFQGPSAATNEMCMFIGTYYPDLGSLDDLCEAGPDMFGVGTAKCTDTLSCVSACPQLSFDQNAPPCIQKCMVDSCPGASAALFPLLECIGSSCATQCATSGSSTCTSCVASNCASQYVACSSATCP